MGYRAIIGTVALLLASAPPSHALTINLTGGTGFSGSPEEQDMRYAAKYWESVLTNKVDVNISVVLTTQVQPNVLAGTSFNTDTYALRDVEKHLIDGGRTALDKQIVTHGLPKLVKGGVNVVTPAYIFPKERLGVDTSSSVLDADGSYNNKFLVVPTANARALGLSRAYSQAIDAEITINSGFNFDFNPSDGIAGLHDDFLAVAIHEIGHALGFDSGVDSYDGFGCPNGPNCSNGIFQRLPVNDEAWGMPLDLFRYSGGQLNWAPGAPAVFSFDRGATPFQGATFSTGDFNGDGHQASHWIDNLYGTRVDPNCKNVLTAPIGIMNPSIGNCEMGVVTALDLSSFDAIGWNTSVDVLADPSYARTTAQIFTAQGGALPVPEPKSTGAAVVGLGVLATKGLRRRRRIWLV